MEGIMVQVLSQRCTQPNVHLCSVRVQERGVLPDYVACLREAASHKEPFDDVDFLIHGLRQAEEI